MSKTVWMDAMDRAERVWVLDNGEIVEEPALEMSGSGRKMRLKGKPETSVYRKDVATLIEGAIEEVAKQREASIMTCVTPKGELGSMEPARLTVDTSPIHRRETTLRSTKLKWRYEHESLPLRATVSVVLRKSWRDSYEVESYLNFDQIGPASQHTPMAGTCSHRWSVDTSSRTYGQHSRDVHEMLSDEYGTLMTETLGDYQANSERDALTRMKKLIDTIDEWDHILIPNTHDHPSWVRLEFIDSNIDGEFLASLGEYVNASPNIEKVAKLYKELSEAIRQLGIVMDPVSEDDFARAVAVDQDQILTVSLKEAGSNPSHTVALHLPTGTLDVGCHTRNAREAEEWTVARFEAEMRGELDAFIGFHANSNSEQRRRVIDIVKERQ